MQLKQVKQGQRYKTTHWGVVVAEDINHMKGGGSRKVICRLASGSTLSLAGHDLICPAEEFERNLETVEQLKLLLEPGCRLSYAPTLKERNIQAELTPSMARHLVHLLGGGSKTEGEGALAELLEASERTE